jgi:hypothetical protein
MRKLLLTSCLRLACLGGLIIFSPSTQGGSIGFKGLAAVEHHRATQWLEHEHSATLDLPRIHEFTPSHVPQLTNEQVLRLFEKDRNLLMFRNNQIELQLGQAMLAQRNLDPTKWDRHHPGLAQLARDPALLQYAIWLYETHQARFTHYHHWLIPVLRGWAMMMKMKQPATTTPPGVGSISTSQNPVPEQITTTNTPGAVPAPPSVVLLVLGMGYVGRRLRMARRHS